MYACPKVLIQPDGKCGNWRRSFGWFVAAGTEIQAGFLEQVYLNLADNPNPYNHSLSLLPNYFSLYADWPEQVVLLVLVLPAW